MAETGLGCVLWWTPSEESTMNDENEGEMDENMLGDGEEEQLTLDNPLNPSVIKPFLS